MRRFYSYLRYVLMKFGFLLLTLALPYGLFGQVHPTRRSDSLRHFSQIRGRREVAKTVGVPVVLFSAGLLAMSSEKHTVLNKVSFQEEFMEHPYIGSFHPEDYTRDLPILAVYGLNAAGIKGKNTFMERSILLAKTMLIQHVLVSTLKSVTDMERPDGGHASFPSSHTSRAFAAATFMHYEYGHLSPWYSIGAYSVATLTGYMRMAHNHHWMNDVLVGAGIGVLSANIAYHTHRFKWTQWRNKQNQKVMSLSPLVAPGYAGILFIGKL